MKNLLRYEHKFRVNKGKLSILNKIVIFLIKDYQKITSKRKHKCLYFPTCSNYGILAYEKYSFYLATKKTINRIRDCHPFSFRKYIDYP